jgi:DNA-binding GntR family transcriptional regulator
MSQTNSDPNPLGAVNPMGPERTVERFIARELRESILSGSLKPGVRLPYRQLAEQFDVSVTPVRIALRELLTEGLVEMRPHGGASVAPLSLEELEELYSMRVGLEAWLSLRGAPRMSDDDLVSMRSHFKNLEEYARTRNRGPYLEAALAYRSVCYAAADRPRLSATTALLFKRTSRYMILSLTKEYRFDQSLEFQRQFGEHCEERDGRGAQQIIREALEWSLEYVSEMLTQLEGDVAPASV